MYLLSVSGRPRPGSGVLYILIGDLTSKIALVLLTLLISSKPHFEKCPGIVKPIKRKQRIQEGLLVILQSKSRG